MSKYTLVYMHHHITGSKRWLSGVRGREVALASSY